MTDQPLPKGSKPERAFRKLTLREKFDIMTLLQKHCKVVDGHATYELGWSDLRIGEEALPTFTGNLSSAVGHIRNSEYGPLLRSRPQSVDVSHLERSLRVAEDRLSDLEDAVVRLSERTGIPINIK